MSRRVKICEETTTASTTTLYSWFQLRIVPNCEFVIPYWCELPGQTGATITLNRFTGQPIRLKKSKKGKRHGRT
jgi:hypothetical protein